MPLPPAPRVPLHARRTLVQVRRVLLYLSLGYHRSDELFDRLMWLDSVPHHLVLLLLLSAAALRFHDGGTGTGGSGAGHTGPSQSSAAVPSTNSLLDGTRDHSTGAGRERRTLPSYHGRDVEDRSGEGRGGRPLRTVGVRRPTGPRDSSLLEPHKTSKTPSPG